MAFELMTAKDVMSANLITVSADMRLFELAGLFRSNRISGAPVVDDQGFMMGVVTMTDLLKFVDSLVQKGQEEARDFLNRIHDVRLKGRVGDIMTREVMTVKRDTRLIEIVGFMLHKNVHTIPVMSDDEKKLVGVIGRHDLVLACLIGNWGV